MASDEMLVEVRGKSYSVPSADLPKLHKMVGKTWLKTVRNYEGQMTVIHEMWKTHASLREDYFFTSHILQAATGAYFPTEAQLVAADKAIQDLKAAANAGKISAIKPAYEYCDRTVSIVAKAMDTYTKAMESSASNLVAAAQFTRDAAKDGVEILSQIVLAKAPGGGAAAAGLSGGYNELLDQIEASQAPNAPGIAYSAAMVIKSGVSDALIKHFLSDGKFGAKILDKFAVEAKKIVGKHLTEKEAEELVDAIWKKQLEELISSSLKELVKAFTPGTKMTWEQALHNVFNDVLKKTGAIQIFGKIPGQITKAQGSVLEKIKKGVIKDVKLEGKELEAEVKKLIENSIEKVVEKAIKSTSGNVDNLANALVDEMIKDSKFKAEVSKVAQKKKK